MFKEALNYLSHYSKETCVYYLDLIRGDDPTAFTRQRKVSVPMLLYQMLTRKNGSQWSDIMSFYEEINQSQDITETGFYLARKKFNPEALRVMSNEYIANMYDDCDDSLKKWNGKLVLSVDGSKIILPDTQENEVIFGRHTTNKGENAPVMGLVSLLHDSLNDIHLDVHFGGFKESEQGYAYKHIEHYDDNYHQEAIFTFDRGYASLRLIDLLIDKKQDFVFRIQSNFLKKYVDQVENDEDKWFDMKFDRVDTNYYRHDRKFRQKLMNTTYRLRILKFELESDGEEKNVEILLTNLPDEYSKEDLKELYHLRWDIETGYNRLKNRMNLEEFSGYKPVLIYQDVYADVWLYNVVSLKILEMNENKPIEQKEGYVLKRNFNKAVGILKRQLLKVLMIKDEAIRTQAFEIIESNIMNNIVWVKKNRHVERKKTLHPSSMSYKKTY